MLMSGIKYRLRVLKKLYPFALGVKRFFVFSFVLSLLSMLTGLITPLVYKIFIDEVIINGNFIFMIIVASGYIGLYIVNTMMGYAHNFVNYRLNNTLLYRVKHKIWTGLFKLPFKEYETMSIGDMKMRLDDDTSQITEFTGGQSIGYIISLFSLITNGLILCTIDIRLALYSILAIPITFLIDNVLSRHEGELNNTNRQNDESMSAWLHASVQGWREVKALGLYKRQERRFIRYLNNYALYFGAWINYWTARVLIVPKIKNEFLMKFGLYFFGGLLIINGKIKISDLLIFTSYYGMLSGSVQSLSSADASLQSNMPYTDRLIEELEKSEITETTNGVIPDKSNIISLEHVSFAYSDESMDVIHDLDLTVNKGDRLAITGKSGAGKTTLLKLICGMITPTKGRITFSGVDLRDIDISAMHQRIGYVMQENILFNTTIRENLLYGRNNASEGELYEALKKAYILDFVKNLPDGLDTVIGERGIKLSGGQRQRIVLARLFLRDVDIFIFDEATSSLDQYSENIIHDTIRSIAEDKTIIIVAHRESSIRLCNRKIELK